MTYCFSGEKEGTNLRQVISCIVNSLLMFVKVQDKNRCEREMA